MSAQQEQNVDDTEYIQNQYQPQLKKFSDDQSEFESQSQDLSDLINGVQSELGSQSQDGSDLNEIEQQENVDDTHQDRDCNQKLYPQLNVASPISTDSSSESESQQTQLEVENPIIIIDDNKKFDSQFNSQVGQNQREKRERQPSQMIKVDSPKLYKKNTQYCKDCETGCEKDYCICIKDDRYCSKNCGCKGCNNKNTKQCKDCKKEGCICKKIKKQCPRNCGCRDCNNKKKND